ncbi:MAG: dUTP diphosphatase [Alphaproteobacteria bacterium]|nr:dUTP diphosphatase [Alphaproteobacteria bacterium]
MKVLIEYLENYDEAWERMGYKHPGDAGFDLRAAIPAPVVVKPGQKAVIPNGFRLALADAPSDAFEVQIRPRSGLIAHHDAMATLGTIDFNYRGEYKTMIFNFGAQDFVVNPGDRISQAVVCPIVRPEILAVASVDKNTARGAGGFGSTGTS